MYFLPSLSSVQRQLFAPFNERRVSSNMCTLSLSSTRERERDVSFLSSCSPLACASLGQSVCLSVGEEHTATTEQAIQRAACLFLQIISIISHSNGRINKREQEINCTLEAGEKEGRRETRNHEVIVFPFDSHPCLP